MRALIVVNPAARGADRGVQPAVTLLTRHGWQVEVAQTGYPGHGTLLARQARGRFEVVVAAGGDGTLNEVINGLAGTEIAVGVLPLGTVNVWAREVGIPQQPLGAARVLLTGERQRIDLGLAGERYFLLMASVGFDAEVIAGVNPTTKRRFGAIPIFLSGLWAGLRSHPWRAHLETNGDARKLDATWVLIGNSRLYGGVARVALTAQLTDGLLDVVVFGRAGPLTRIVWAVAAVLGHHVRFRAVTYFRTAALTLIPEQPRPVQVDGDPAGRTPMHFRCVPQALTVLVPAGAAPALFQTGTVAR